MRTIEELLHDGHGVITTAELSRAGFDRHRIDRALAAGELCRVAQGRFVSPDVCSLPSVDISPSARCLDAIGQARVLGGSVSCVSALATHGIWTPPFADQQVHIRVPVQRARGGWAASSLRQRFAPGACLHVLPEPWRRSFPTQVDAASVALLAADQCLPKEQLVAALDSATRVLALDPATVRGLTSRAGARLRDAGLHVDGRADSGVESIVRMRLASLRLKFTVQERIAGWPVDFLIGGWLVVEIDGFEYHSRTAEFSRDRVKDRALDAAGFTVLRFTYHDVMFGWSRVQDVILAYVRARRHHSGRRPIVV